MVKTQQEGCGTSAGEEGAELKQRQSPYTGLDVKVPGQGGCVLRTFAHTWAMRRVLKLFARVLCCWGDDRGRADSEKIGSQED